MDIGCLNEKRFYLTLPSESLEGKVFGITISSGDTAVIENGDIQVFGDNNW